MKRAVITGATSMIGLATLEECVKNEIEVLAIVRKNSENLDRLPDSNLVTICECDLDELGSVDASAAPYDVFYHMAWSYTSKEGRDCPAMQEKNIKYTLDAVELAERLGCKKFIGAGSQAEYGRVDGIITPDTPTEPLTPYGIAKYAANLLSKRLCQQKGMTHIWGRIFSVYGRNDHPHTMLSHAIDQYIKGETAEFSAATQMWDYLHEKDAGRIFYLLGEKANKDKVYCVASGDSRPLRNYIEEMSRCFGAETRNHFANTDTSENRPLSLIADISDLRNDIGFRPSVSFTEGITDMIQFRREATKNCRKANHY